MSDRIVDARDLKDWSELMKRDWDDRARRDAKWFINPLRFQQTDSEFDESGASAVQRLVIDDLDLLARDRDPASLRVLELGCGIGRMTRFLASIFNEVHATDVSGEMISQARSRLADLQNVRLYETSGYDFADLPTAYFDLVVSAFVFQHVPSTEIICANLRDAYRVLKPGGFMKFQTNSLTAFDFEEIEKDTWLGASLPEGQIRCFAEDVDAQILSLSGAGSQHCWTILRKRIPHGDRRGVTSPLEIRFHGQTDHPTLKEIPLNGMNSSLTLLVAGLNREAVDCNSVCVDISGLEILPHYVGPVRQSLLALVDSLGIESASSLTRVDLSLPVGAPTGAAEVRVQLTDGETSPPVRVDFVSPQPVIPRIILIVNAVDGGEDVRVRGSKSLVRLHVEGLDETADRGNIRVQIGERILKPARVSLERTGLHLVEARLPHDIGVGQNEVRLYFGDLASQPVRFEVLGAEDPQ